MPGMARLPANVLKTLVRLGPHEQPARGSRKAGLSPVAFALGVGIGQIVQAHVFGSADSS